MDTTTALGKVKLSNPSVLASGILGTTAKILQRVIDGGAGAVTLKSIGPEERGGHDNPTVLEWDHGFINAVGLPSEGYLNLTQKWQELNGLQVPVIASIYGSSVRDFAKVAEEVSSHKPDMIELNVSCPNTDREGMAFGTDPNIAHKVVSSVKNVSGRVPVMPKLTPNCPDIVSIAKACEDAGADAISGINTVGPGMIINIDAARPVLSYKKGGLSGPAIKPVAVRCIYEIYESVKIPILGIGGITYGKDAVEIMMAGASAFGIGSAVYYRGTDVFGKVVGEITDWMKANGYNSVKELVGAAH
ncbi:MAG: dihydroorotate dehydrogenase [archaeon]